MAKYFYRIPDGVTKINKETFVGREEIEIVYIPNTVKTIVTSSFEEMLELRVLVVPCGFIQPSGLVAAFKKGFEAEVRELNVDEFVDDEGVIFQGKQKLVGTVYAFDPDFGGEGFENYRIPEGVEEIEKDGFRRCQDLESIHIPNTVKSIGGDYEYDAFSSCFSLKELHIPSSVISLGGIIFPENLETLELPEHLLNISLESLYSFNADSIQLKKLHIIKGNDTSCWFDNPNSDLIKIEEVYVDDDCIHYSSIDGLLFNKDLTQLVWCPAGRIKDCNLPDGLKMVASYAFYDCDELQKIHLPNSVIEIGEKAFSYCINLKKLHIPDMVETIGEEAFSYCINLKKLHIPDMVETLGERAFEGCEKMNVIHIPKGLRRIGLGAFRGCDGVKKVYVADNWEKGNIISEVMGGCNNVAEILIDKSCVKYSSKDGVLYDSKMMKLVSYPSARGEDEYTVPEGVKKLGKNAFFNSDVKKLFIPSSVTAIEYSFVGSHKLKEIIVDKDNPKFSSRDGVLFNKDKTELVCYPQGRDIQEYTIPETVEIIGDFAFNNCSFLKEVLIPLSVKIGTNAFEGCNCKQIPV
jgi:hypothetical protein